MSTVVRESSILSPSSVSPINLLSHGTMSSSLFLSINETHNAYMIAQALIQKLSVDNLRMTGRELSFRTQLEAIATRRRGDSTIMLGKESTKSTLSSKEASSRVFRG